MIFEQIRLTLPAVLNLLSCKKTSDVRLLVEARGVGLEIFGVLPLLFFVARRKFLRSPFKNSSPESFFTAFDSPLARLRQKENTAVGGACFLVEQVSL